jgi:hypothetical protein
MTGFSAVGWDESIREGKSQRGDSDAFLWGFGEIYTQWELVQEGKYDS